jgi:hypothetical protein
MLKENASTAGRKETASEEEEEEEVSAGEFNRPALSSSKTLHLCN